MNTPLNEISFDAANLMKTGHWLVLLVMGVYLFAFLLQGFFGKRLGKAGDGIAVGLSGVAGVLALFAWWEIRQRAGNLSVMDSPMLEPQWEWFSVGGLHVRAGLFLNEVSATMLALVAGITFLVHLYSAEYMRHDERRARYWAFLALFAFSMCGVVLASSFFIIFIFWELVGFSSYLLIGFWYQKEVAARASQKAFLVNRIGDVGFVIALMCLAAYPDSFNNLLLENTEPIPRRYYSFSETDPINRFHDGYGWQFYVFGIGLITGVLSKSAQFPLQIWLKDAMAGPTPVSSLLHAATMVAAGVYLLIRAFNCFPPELTVGILYIGVFTALIAALSALRQTDIKGVLAYSTISQLGFMLLGIGIGRIDFAFFHLLTHAFFKCGLFLCAGAVIHQIHGAQHQSGTHFDAQDMRLMGGLGKKMPLTMACYLIFAASLAGLPLFSGFLSKDGILLGSMNVIDGPVYVAIIPIIGILASTLTAFYIARQGLLIFFGPSRMDHPTFDKLSRVNWKMWLPLAVLAVFSFWVIWSPLHPFHAELDLIGLQSSVIFLIGEPHYDWFPWLLTALALAGIGFAYLRWRQGAFVREKERGFGKVLQNHFGIDWFYEQVIAKGLLQFAAFLAWFDRKVVDGLVNGIARSVVRDDGKWSLAKLGDSSDRKVVDAAVNGLANGVMGLGQRLRRVQAGNLQRYLVLSLLGLLALLAALIYFGGFWGSGPGN